MHLLGIVAVAFLCAACSPTAPESIPVGSKDKNASVLLTEADVRIASTVDTTGVADREAIACLRRFFARKLLKDAPNDYWYAPDFEQYGAIYSEVLYAEYDSVGDLRYPPTLVGMRHVDGERMLDVQWCGQDGLNGCEEPHLAFGFLVKSTPEGPRLALPIAHNTKHWQRRTLGQVTYIISPEHGFNEAQALEQQRIIDRLATFFEVATFPISYFSFSGPADLFAAKGFAHHPLMHTITSGGMVDGKANVYSGNDKDIYVHEITHLFSQSRTPTPPPLLEEGLAMLIGGSVEHDYAWHRANMARYLASDSTIDLRDRCNTYERDDIYTDTSVPYVIGALLCEHILRRDGKEGLFNLMAAGADPWPALRSDYNITPENVTALLRAELKLPQVVAP